jgi:ABC-type nickel/cobalt efflux system permease component RcnA
LKRSGRRWLGVAALTVFVLVYVAGAMIIGARFVLELPAPVQLAYYVVAGFAWTPVAMAIIRWMRREPTAG